MSKPQGEPVPPPVNHCERRVRAGREDGPGVSYDRGLKEWICHWHWVRTYPPGAGKSS